VRLLILSPIGHLGGAERSLLDLISSLRACNTEIEMSLISFSDGALLPRAAALGVSTEVLELPQKFAELGDSVLVDRNFGLAAKMYGKAGVQLVELMSFRHELQRRIRNFRPDVVLSNGIKAHLLGALARPRSRNELIWYLHDFVSARPVSRRLLRMLRSRCSLVIGISEAVARDAEKEIPGVPVVPILNGIRTRDYAASRLRPLDLDALGGFSPASSETLRVGLIATYASWKGHMEFLRAAAELRDTPARFYIVGGAVYSTDGSQVTNSLLAAEVRRLGLGERVALVPFQNEIERVFAALDIVVHASTRPEPFGRTIAEALASGKAVVASAAGGVLEQVVHERNGLLYAPSDEHGIANAVRRLLCDPRLRETLAAEGRTVAATKLDYSRLGPEFVEALQRHLSVPMSHSVPAEGR
jgi:glycosyltransferase involved in cell wall biosynthesis